MPIAARDEDLRGCPACGLVQLRPAVPPGMRACCARCGAALPGRRPDGLARSRTAAVAVAALLLYPLGVTLPLMRIERFGHAHEASVLEGVSSLLGSGHVAVGIVVLLCSVVLPLAKLLALLILSSGRGLGRRHQALTYRVVEWTGRFGMLDVLLVAILVAILKLGDLMEVSVGPGLAAFTSCVALSLVATACFDPHELWEPRP